MKRKLLILILMVTSFVAIVLAREFLVFRTENTAKPVGPAAARSSIVSILMGFHETGSSSSASVESTELEAKISSGILEAKGWTESGGLHGDGADWFEMELSSEQMRNLRKAISAQAQPVELRRVPISETGPKWWPKSFPAETEIYRKENLYLFLPKEGNHMWVFKFRS